MEPQVNLEAESCVLASMVMEPALIPKILSTIRREDFSSVQHQLVFDGIVKLYHQKGGVDLVLLRDVLGDQLKAAGGPEKLMAMMEGLPNAANWGGYCEAIQECRRKREIGSGLDLIQERVRQGEPSREIINALRGLCRGRTEGIRTFTLQQTVAEAIRHLASIKETGLDLVTGWRQVDGDLCGLQRKHILIVGADTSHGKTSIATNLTLTNLRRNGRSRVLFNVFENIEQIPTRLASMMSGVPLSWYLKPYLLTPEQYAVVEASLQALDEFKDRLVIMNSASLAEMRAICDEFKPDIIVLDYLQKYAQRYNLAQAGRLSHEVGKVVSDLQDIAIDYNANAICLSQLHRRPEEKAGTRPNIHNLKESGDIENCADDIILVWWPWRANPDKSKDDPNDYTVILAKNKTGPIGEYLLKIDVQTLKIADYGKDNG